MKKQILMDGKGFTLVEIMVVLVLSTLLMGAVFISHQAQHKNGRVQEQTAAIQQDLRAIMDIIEKDIQNSGCDPSGSSLEAIVSDSSGASTLAMHMDLDGDGAITAENENISYSLSGTDLIRTDTGAGETQILTNNVTQFGVRYFDSSNSEITPSSTLTAAQSETVLYIEVSLTTRSEDKDPDTGDYITRSFSREIKSRNMEIELNP